VSNFHFLRQKEIFITLTPADVAQPHAVQQPQEAPGGRLVLELFGDFAGATFSTNVAGNLESLSQQVHRDPHQDPKSCPEYAQASGSCRKSHHYHLGFATQPGVY
jgi:hypothetical protein